MVKWNQNLNINVLTRIDRNPTTVCYPLNITPKIIVLTNNTDATIFIEKYVLTVLDFKKTNVAINYI